MTSNPYNSGLQSNASSTSQITHSHGPAGRLEESDPTYPSQLLWGFQLKRQHADHIEKTLAIEERLRTFDIELKSLKSKLDRQTPTSKEKQGINQAVKKLGDAGKYLERAIDSINRTINEHEKSCVHTAEELQSVLKTQQTRLEDSEGNIHEMGIDLASMHNRLARLETVTRELPQTGGLPRKSDKTDTVVTARRIDAIEARLRLFEAQRRADREMIEQLKHRLAQFSSSARPSGNIESCPRETPPVPRSSPSREGSSAIVSPLVLKQSRSADLRPIQSWGKRAPIPRQRLRHSIRLARTVTKPTSEIVRYVNKGLKRRQDFGKRPGERQGAMPMRQGRLQAEGHLVADGNLADLERAGIETPLMGPSIEKTLAVEEPRQQATTPSHHDPLKPTRFWPEGARRKRRFMEMESLQSSPVASP